MRKSGQNDRKFTCVEKAGSTKHQIRLNEVRLNENPKHTYQILI